MTASRAKFLMCSAGGVGPAHLPAPGAAVQMDGGREWQVAGTRMWCLEVSTAAAYTVLNAFITPRQQPGWRQY